MGMRLANGRGEPCVRPIHESQGRMNSDNMNGIGEQRKIQDLILKLSNYMAVSSGLPTRALESLNCMCDNQIYILVL